MARTLTRWAPSGRRCTEGMSNSSNWTSSAEAAGSAARKDSNRDLSQRRAAPVPRVSESGSERVWRVPKEARVSTECINSAGLTALITAAARGASGAGWI